MKNFIKKITATLGILFLIGTSSASAIVSQRDLQLVLNGNFEDGTTNWTASNAATLSSVNGVGSIGSAMRIDAGSTTSRAISSFSASPGVSYRIRGYARSDGTSVPQGNWVGHSSFSLNLVPAIPTSFTFFDVVVVAPVGSSWQFALLNNNATSSGWVEFDNISITRYYGNVTNRDANGVVDSNMEASGTTAYTGINGGTLTKESGALNTTGANVIRNTNSVSSGGAFRNNPTFSVLLGQTYKIKGQVRCSSSAISPTINRVTGATQNLWGGVTGTSIQFIDTTVTMNADGYIAFYNNENDGAPYNQYCDWDNLSITRYYGNVTNRDTQLAVNGNFENGATGWASTGASASEVAPPEGVDGTKAIRITQTSYPAGGYLYQNILPVNTPYTFRAMARGDGVSTTRVLLGATVNCVSAVLTTDWRPVSCTMTSPSTNTNLYIGVLNSTANGWAEFDNVSITRLY